jgi:hypothetical protein
MMAATMATTAGLMMTEQMNTFPVPDQEAKMMPIITPSRIIMNNNVDEYTTFTDIKNAERLKGGWIVEAPLMQKPSNQTPCDVMSIITGNPVCAWAAIPSGIDAWYSMAAHNTYAFISLGSKTTTTTILKTIIPESMAENELEKLLKESEQLQEDSNWWVWIFVGGSIIIAGGVVVIGIFLWWKEHTGERSIARGEIALRSSKRNELSSAISLAELPIALEK